MTGRSLWENELNQEQGGGRGKRPGQVALPWTISKSIQHFTAEDLGLQNVEWLPQSNRQWQRHTLLNFKKLDYKYVQKSARIISIHLDRFSRSEHTHVVSAEVKKWRTAEAHHVLAQSQSLCLLSWFQTASSSFAHCVWLLLLCMSMRHNLLHKFIHHLNILPFIHSFHCRGKFGCFQFRVIINQ